MREVWSRKSTRSAKCRWSVSCLLPTTLVIAALLPPPESSTQEGTLASTVRLRSLQMATFRMVAGQVLGQGGRVGRDGVDVVLHPVQGGGNRFAGKGGIGGDQDQESCHGRSLNAWVTP